MSSIFHSFSNWIMGGLKRSTGIQYSAPAAYTEPAAADVTFDSAMQLSAVWACVKLLSETVASLPLNVYRKDGQNRELADDHPLTLLFSNKVNRYQNRIEFFETVMLNLILHGNAYCQIIRNGGRINGLMPLMTPQIEQILLEDGSLVYQYTNDTTGITVFAESSIWHLKLMGNGVIGLSPLAYQRNSLGIAQAAETAVTKIYRNGAKPSGVLTMDRILTNEQRALIREKFATLTNSTDDRLLVLEGGMKFDPVSMSPQDIELLSSRKFQIADICRWYGVPSVMVNDNNGTSTWGSGIEQIMQGFYKLTLRPLLEKIEASIMVNLIDSSERAGLDVEFNFDALLRSDIRSRFDAYRIGIASGILTPNEARMAEFLPTMPGGDRLLIQGAMIPLENAGQTSNVPAVPEDIQ